MLIVNTCSFIEPARDESIQAILAAAEYKKTGRLRRLVVAGCLVQRYADALKRELPEVDAFVDLDELHTIPDRVGPNVDTPDALRVVPRPVPPVAGIRGAGRRALVPGELPLR